MDSRLNEFLGDRLASAREEMIREWLDWSQSRYGTSTAPSLSRSEVRNHVPQVLASLIRILRDPAEALRSETVSDLRMHGQVRREQGYDIRELLIEFDQLGRILMRRLTSALGEYEHETQPGDVGEATETMGRALRAMAFVTVGCYRDREHELDRGIAVRFSEFADILVHELRQPLNAISMASQMLAKRGTSLDESAHGSFVSSITSNVKRVARLLDDVKILARSETARANSGWIRVEHLVRSVFEELQPAADSGGVELRIGELTDTEVESVPARLALLNLVDNGIKYASDERQQRFVEVTGQRDDEVPDALLLRVRDNGIGIEEQHSQRILQKRFRGNPEHIDGLGLGLWIAHEMLTMVGGELWLEESEPGRGSTFAMRVRGASSPRPEPASGDMTAEATEMLLRSLQPQFDLQEEAEATARAEPSGND